MGKRKRKIPMRVHLIDGTYELFRSYFGAPAAQFQGQEVGATRGFLRSLWSLLKESDTTHVAVAFDTTVECFRNELFDGYKTGEGLEPELLTQFPLVEKATAALGVTVWSMVDFEADDALATGAKLFGSHKKVDEVWIASPDKDLTQCVEGDRIITWDRMRKKTFNEQAVIEKFGVLPHSIPDYLALVGDAADGIPGIPRWGAKSTSKLLAEYQSIDSIPDDESQWTVSVRGAAALAANLREQREEAELYRVLATLRRDVPLNGDVNILEFKGVNGPLLESFCREIGDERFLSRVNAFQ
jgi:5'-3' exonuclease